VSVQGGNRKIQKLFFLQGRGPLSNGPRGRKEVTDNPLHEGGKRHSKKGIEEGGKRRGSPGKKEEKDWTIDAHRSQGKKTYREKDETGRFGGGFSGGVSEGGVRGSRGA